MIKEDKTNITPSQNELYKLQVLPGHLKNRTVPQLHLKFVQNSIKGLLNCILHICSLSLWIYNVGDGTAVTVLTS